MSPAGTVQASRSPQCIGQESGLAQSSVWSMGLAHTALNMQLLKSYGEPSSLHFSSWRGKELLFLSVGKVHEWTGNWGLSAGCT